LEGLKAGNLNAFEGAFLVQDVVNGGTFRLELIIAKQVHHIVQVTRPSPFAQSAHLFCKSLLVGVAAHHEPTPGLIGVRMRDAPLGRGEDQQLIGCQVEPDAGQVTPRG